MPRTSSDGERCLANAAYQADTGKIKGGCSEHFNFSQVLRIENDHQHRWPMRFNPLTSVPIMKAPMTIYMADIQTRKNVIIAMLVVSQNEGSPIIDPNIL